MFKKNIANLILSRVNIDKVKTICANTPILNSFFKIGAQNLIDYRYPTHLFVETTRACNLKCKSCPSSTLSSGIGHMDFDLFTKIIDEATSFGSKNFCLHMLGEPLLYPRIADAVKYIKSSNPQHSILLTTNGYFLDNEKAEMLLDNGVDKIAISIFSLSADVSKMLTGSSDIDKVLENLKNLASLKRKKNSKTKMYIRFLLCDENKNELEKIKSISKDAGVLLEVIKTHNYSGLIKDNYTSKFKLKKRYPCYHLWFSPAVSWDGKVVLCCNDANYTATLGDLREKSLSEIWQGEKLKTLRDHHMSGEYGKISLCESCNVWSKYPDIFFGIQKKGSR